MFVPKAAIKTINPPEDTAIAKYPRSSLSKILAVMTPLMADKAVEPEVSIDTAKKRD
jgi:hypothetical protein